MACTSQSVLNSCLLVRVAGQGSGPLTTPNVTEQDARKVAEAARETEWRLPSFGKEMFLGRYRLDLLYPQPDPDPDMAEKGEAFLAKLPAFLEERVHPLQNERDRKIPADVVQGLKDLGTLGLQIPAAHGRGGAPPR